MSNSKGSFTYNDINELDWNEFIEYLILFNILINEEHIQQKKKKEEENLQLVKYISKII